jgi:hypothetical protein
VPRNINKHLEEALGAGWVDLYKESKWEDHHAGPPQLAHDHAATPAATPAATAATARDALSERTIGVGKYRDVVKECWRLHAGVGAGWEKPRWRSSVMPTHEVSDTFAVFLCSQETQESGGSDPRASGGEGGAGGGGGTAPAGAKSGWWEGAFLEVSEAKGEIVVVRRRGCEAERRGFLNPGVLARGMEELIARTFGPDEFVTDLVGPELLALQQHHVGHCIYSFPFEVCSS